MGSPNLMSNLMTGDSSNVNRSLSATGVIPVGNGAGSNTPGNTALGNASAAIPGPQNPIQATAQPIMQNALIPGGPGNQIFDPAQQQASDKQLTNVFGKGVGGDINALINNLGSNDSTYMQAYNTAMQGQNAQDMATLQTTLGNEGVSANSSTAAIAQSQLLSQESAQEGLQEQQLQQTDQQDLIGLLGSTEQAANKQASTSIWGDIGSVLGSIGQDTSQALSGTNLAAVL